jgi:hypothetical protein
MTTTTTTTVLRHNNNAVIMVTNGKVLRDIVYHDGVVDKNNVIFQSRTRKHLGQDY